MALLEVKNISKNFGTTRVLKDISFEVDKGEVLVLIGSSGSGKTTLLRCLNFLETPDTGKIILNGETLVDAGAGSKRESESGIRRKRLHFGMVFQSFNLFPQYNVLRNVTLAMDILSKESLKKPSPFKLAELRENYPCELSGGQCQRVAIARALALSPDILCFDEPTSALDPELTGEVLKVIKGLKSSDRTMIVVTHEMEFARGVADKVIFMADGVIEETGTPDEVFGNPKSPKTKAFLSKASEVV